MRLSDKFSVPPQVVAREVGDETVILDLATGTYFGLDPVGAQMWRLLEAGNSLSEICSALIDDYDVSPEVIQQDLLTLVRDLVEKKLMSAE